MKCEELFGDIINSIKEQYEIMADDTSESCVITLPFKDSMGDRFIIRIRENNNEFVIDDGGLIENTLFTIRETTGDRRAKHLVDGINSSFGARYNSDEGVIEIRSEYSKIKENILHFGKLLLTADTMLTQTVSEEKKEEKPHRQSLGPRASQRLRKSIHPLIKEGLINYRYSVDGLTIPDWLVDFVYKPRLKPLSESCELIVIITVDLAVIDPIMKSTYAFSRAWDIKKAHEAYDIRVAYDTHGQNNNSAYAAKFLSENQLYTKAYQSINMSETKDYAELLERINSETSLNLRY